MRHTCTLSSNGMADHMNILHRCYNSRFAGCPYVYEMKIVLNYIAAHRCSTSYRVVKMHMIKNSIENESCRKYVGMNVMAINHSSFLVAFKYIRMLFLPCPLTWQANKEEIAVILF